MASKSRSKHQKDLYASYKARNTFATNRRRKLEALAKVHPNNEQIAQALKSIKYRRKTPNTRVWNPVLKAYARLVKSVQGKFNYKVETERERVVLTGKPSASKLERTSKDPSGWYSIGARAGLINA